MRLGYKSGKRRFPDLFVNVQQSTVIKRPAAYDYD